MATDPPSGGLACPLENPAGGKLKLGKHPAAPGMQTPAGAEVLSSAIILARCNASSLPASTPHRTACTTPASSAG